MNRVLERVVKRMMKGSFLIWMVVLMTGCATPLITPAASGSQSGVLMNTTQPSTSTPGILETAPPLLKSPSSKPSFVVGNCQQAAPPAGPSGSLNSAAEGGKPGLPSNPVLGLQQALQLANQEMGAAAQSTNLDDARNHAEAVVNILVGYWGCWYGDADGNGLVNDPSNGYGVLPAGRVQSAAPDTKAAQLQLGWALNTYEQGGSNAQKQIQIILGNVKQWQNNPVAGYEQIQQAVQNSDVNRPQVDKLDGQAVQAVAWARLILVKAQTTDQAVQFAKDGLRNTTEALQASRQIS